MWTVKIKTHYILVADTLKQTFLLTTYLKYHAVFNIFCYPQVILWVDQYLVPSVGQVADRLNLVGTTKLLNWPYQSKLYDHTFKLELDS